MVGCSDQNNVYPLVIKQPPIILMPGGDTGVNLLRRCLDLLSDFFVDQRQVEYRLVGIGDCHDVAIRLRPLSDYAALIAEADHAKAGPGILQPWGRGRLGFCRRTSPHQGEGRRRRLTDKCPAIHESPPLTRSQTIFRNVALLLPRSPLLSCSFYAHGSQVFRLPSGLA